MRKHPKRRFFWICMMTGVLVAGTPVYASAENGAVGNETELPAPEGQIQPPDTLPAEPGSEGFVDDATNNTYGYYTIMGKTTVTSEQMTCQFYSQNLPYPGEVLGQGGAPDMESFCEILMEEAAAEGVRAEVVFAQVILETGWLQFQGVCRPEQYNFAGLGATGGDEPGNCFSDVRTGLRAQVQHLKAYASSEELEQECVDERFDLVQRECAPYVEWLGIQENPYGSGWAAGEHYGYKLRDLLAEMKGETYIWPQETREENKSNVVQ